MFKPQNLRHTLLVCATVFCAAAQAQGIKPGLWEMQNKMGGNPQMDQAMAEMQKQMANMPAAQRKQMEEMLAKQGMSMPSAAAGGGMSTKICITPEMAARQELPVQDKGDCSSTVTSRSGNVMKMSFVCKNPPSSGEGTYTFTGDSAYTMKMQIKTVQQGKPQSMTMDGSGQWLAASCGNIKPLK